MQQGTRLFTIYTRFDPYLYGAVSIVGPEAIAQGGTIPLKWSYPYVVSKHLEDREIVYGSILYLIGEAAKPIFRMNHRIRALADSLPEDIRSSIRVDRTNNALIHKSPTSEFPDWFLHRQEELTKEGLLLSGLHLRTLLEILSGKGDIPIALYDYENNSTGTVSLNRLFNTLMHLRYCVISGEYVHDIFSGRSKIDSPRLFGSKMKSAELFNTMLTYVSRITINDLVGVLRGQLERLNVDSEPWSIMLAIQNVHSLAEIIGDRITDGRFTKMQELLFREFTAEEKRKIEDSRRRTTAITLVRKFGKPSFKIDAALNEKRIEMSININGKLETFRFDQGEFFRALTQVYGDDSVVPWEKLVERYDNPGV